MQSVGSYCGGYVPEKVAYVQEFVHKERNFRNNSVERPSSCAGCIFKHFYCTVSAAWQHQYRIACTEIISVHVLW